MFICNMDSLRPSCLMIYGKQSHHFVGCDAVPNFGWSMTGPCPWASQKSTCPGRSAPSSGKRSNSPPVGNARAIPDLDGNSGSIYYIYIISMTMRSLRLMRKEARLPLNDNLMKIALREENV